ncbi:HIT domain-containing protein [bacterium]|nr:HIT domain-containing protein [bacterium]MBU1599630.1 HIT domain-containing protein [bacterium]MBU2461324.1 HIT domain-containing protein [bacterium]
MDDCIFCKIVKGEIPARIAFKGKQVLGFYDINPQAPVHILLIPKEHIPTLLELKDKELRDEFFSAICEIGNREELKNGFRLIANIGKDSGCEVSHLHFHILSGRKLGWPPG